jgi:uncharacterized protein (DUF2062 family)
MAILAVVFGLTYAVSSVLRGHVVSGIVTGVIGAVLVFLVLVRVQEYNDAARRRRERERE